MAPCRRISWNTTTGLTVLAALLLSYNVAAAPGSSPGASCVHPDGSPANEYRYNNCKQSAVCCPDSTECDFSAGLCVKVEAEEVIFIRGAYESVAEASVSFCAAEVPDALAFLVSCGGNEFCCGRSPFENCCDSDSLITIPGVEAIYAKYVSDDDDDDGGSGDQTTSRYGHGWTTTSYPYYTKDKATTVTSSVSATTTVTDSASPLPEGAEELNKHDATKLIAIGVGLGVGGALFVVAIVFLGCKYVKRKRRAAEDAVLAAKSVAGSEAPSPSTVSTPIDNSERHVFANLPASGGQLGLPTRPIASPRSVSPNPPAPPYSPPQYDAGEYQYLVVDGPMPSHSTTTGGSRSGGLPVDADGKPRLED